MAKVHDHAMRGERGRRGEVSRDDMERKERNTKSRKTEGYGDVRRKEIIQDRNEK